MSSAFVKENEEQWLHDVLPTLAALEMYLTRENNNIRVSERRSYMDVNTKKDVYEMSNGLSYSKDENGKWFVV